MFCAAFFGQFMQYFCLIYYYRKYPICFALHILANLCNVFVLYIIQEISYTFCVAFFGQFMQCFCHIYYIGNILYVLCCVVWPIHAIFLSYISYRKYPICFALRFLANSCNIFVLYIK